MSQTTKSHLEVVLGGTCRSGCTAAAATAGAGACDGAVPARLLALKVHRTRGFFTTTKVCHPYNGL